MRKFIILILIVNSINAIAQTPQIALVRPNTATTLIFSSLDSAYLMAQDYDEIYLPGGVFDLSDSVKKNIHFFGAGFNPDSSLTTGVTKIRSWMRFGSSANGAVFEGIEFILPWWNGSQPPSFIIGDISITIAYCKAQSISGGNNMFLRNSIIGYLAAPKNSLISNCIIGGVGFYNYSSCGASASENCTFQNNIIAHNGYLYSNSVYFINNAIFRNNIFLDTTYYYSPSGCMGANLTMENNLNLYTNSNSNEVNLLYENSIINVFTNPNSTDGNYGDLLPTCVGKNGGTDGTDVGIYGGQNPCSKGWVPSNPHIYFKQVNGVTNSNGQLQINYKVRKGSQ